MIESLESSSGRPSSASPSYVAPEPEQGGVEPEPGGSRPVRSSKIPWIVAGVLAVTSVVFCVLWLSASSDADDARADAAQAHADLDRIEAASRANDAAEAALPDFNELARKEFLGQYKESGSERSLSLNFRGGKGMGDLEDLLIDHLEFNPAIMDRIGNTRALDGTLTGESRLATMTWTYHPDAGLSVVVERKD